MRHLVGPEDLVVARVAGCLERPHRQIHESREGLPVRKRDLGGVVAIEQRRTVNPGEERKTVRHVSPHLLLRVTVRNESGQEEIRSAQLIAQREEKPVELPMRFAVRVDRDGGDPRVGDLELVEFAQAEAHLVGRPDRGPARRYDVALHG